LLSFLAIFSLIFLADVLSTMSLTKSAWYSVKTRYFCQLTTKSWNIWPSLVKLVNLFFK
jgi:hypothetical protein